MATNDLQVPLASRPAKHRATEKLRGEANDLDMTGHDGFDLTTSSMCQPGSSDDEPDVADYEGRTDAPSSASAGRKRSSALSKQVSFKDGEEDGDGVKRVKSDKLYDPKAVAPTDRWKSAIKTVKSTAKTTGLISMCLLDAREKKAGDSERRKGERLSLDQSMTMSQGVRSFASTDQELSYESKDSFPSHSRPFPHALGGMRKSYMDDSGQVDLSSLRPDEYAAGQSAVPEGWGCTSGGGQRTTDPPDWWQAGQEATSTFAQIEGDIEKGPRFHESTWAYYSHSGRWSDGMGAPAQSLKEAAFCCCPFLWPIRLYLTIRRAVPVELWLTCLQFRLIVLRHQAVQRAGCLTFLIATLLLSLPVSMMVALYNGYSVTKVHDSLHKMTMGSMLEKPGLVAGVFFVSLAFLGGLLLWAQIITAVGWKYNIKDSQQSCFLMKACCCPCAYNVRVGLHIDRAQGFKKPNKYVEQMVQMTEHAAAQARVIADAPPAPEIYRPPTKGLQQPDSAPGMSFSQQLATSFSADMLDDANMVSISNQLSR